MSDSRLLVRTAATGIAAALLAGGLARAVGPDPALVAPTVGIWFLGGIGLGYGDGRYPDLVAANPPEEEDGFTVTTRRGWLAMNLVGAVASAVLFVGLMTLVSGQFDTPRSAAWAGVFFAATMPITTGVIAVYGHRTADDGDGGSPAAT